MIGRSDLESSRIVFLSEQTGNPEIHAMNGDGSHRDVVTENWARQIDADVPTTVLSGNGDSLLTLDICSRPDWSPDGQTIAYEESVENPDIWIMNADGTDRRSLTSDNHKNEQPNWSPDGDWLAFVSDRTDTKCVFVCRRNGSEIKQLTEDVGDALYPTWSPSGSQISFSFVQNGCRDVLLVDVRSRQTQKLTQGSNDEGKSWWSPDGERLLYNSIVDGKMCAHVMKSDGTARTTLTTDSSNNEAVYGWSPDGQKILISSTREENEDLYLLESDSDNAVRLTFGDCPEGKCSAWNASWFSMGN